ncbi:hypothetical protein OH76DRAFT_1412385 [Lentinus brumalis]|uniref:Uncharacterized protein n=1 Tax=Lentinus brumalis TaxID=2498619 RepID=A0A371CLC4_9APHY|nr:hypothetical protein OH76DRAFT_1412385 [Polyporus brumalis]
MYLTAVRSAGGQLLTCESPSRLFGPISIWSLDNLRVAPDATSTARVASESRASLRCALQAACSLWNRWLVQGRARTRPDSSPDDAATGFRLQFTRLSCPLILQDRDGFPAPYSPRYC